MGRIRPTAPERVKMECKSDHFRHILPSYFCKGKNAAQAAKKLRGVFAQEAFKDR